jgi:AraC-like DNA-binding protein
MSFVPLKAELERCIAANSGRSERYSTAIGDVFVLRTESPVAAHHMEHKPALCVIVQGEMQVLYDSTTLTYGPMQAVAVGVGQPAYGKVTKASSQEPFLGLTIEFDAPVLLSVMERLEPPPTPAPGDGFDPFIYAVAPPLADCLTRLVRILRTPNAVSVLYPSIMNEIAYWLLTGPGAGHFCKLAVPSGQMRRVTEAIDLIRVDLTRPIRIADLAASVRMSESSFHHYFKILTSMTPLQYQKRLRLIEARRLLEAGGANVTSTAYRVGYQSASQFSREYKRMFNRPPKRGANIPSE